jgi:hypothetical protein
MLFMKRLLFILFITGAITSAKAQSMLRVHLTDNSQVNIEVDSRYFNKRGTGVTVGDLPPGKHRLKIYAVNQGRRGRGYEEAIYDGKIRTTDGMILLFEYDPNADTISVQEQQISAYMSSQPQLNAQIQAHNENNNGYNNNGNNYAANNGGYNDNNGGYHRNGGYRVPMNRDALPTLTDAKIDQLKTEVSAKNTDTERQKMLQDELQNEKMSTVQISTIMDWFNFESSKVDFAEWAYNNTVDKENFGNLDAKFTYQEYKDALDKFINSK